MQHGPTEIQTTEPMPCGPGALLIVCALYGKAPDTHAALGLADAEGMTRIDALVDALQGEGVACHVGQADMRWLATLTHPAILELREGNSPRSLESHFVVAVPPGSGVSTARCVDLDANGAIRGFPLEVVQQQWSGVAIMTQEGGGNANAIWIAVAAGVAFAGSLVAGILVKVGLRRGVA